MSHLSQLSPLLSSQALSKALLELRAELTSAAEQQVIASAAQKEESLNVQMLVDRHTKDLKVTLIISLMTFINSRVIIIY